MWIAIYRNKEAGEVGGVEDERVTKGAADVGCQGNPLTSLYPVLLALPLDSPLILLRGFVANHM